MDRGLVASSKFLSLVLRHKPDEIGLTLDGEGWADLDELIANARSHGQQLDRELVLRIVAENEKQRFAVSSDGRRIRANQGHSLDVDLALSAAVPPAELYHGTALGNLASIRETGLNPGRRQHVHLSLDAQTATRVGARHGKPVVLTIASQAMHRAGHAFYCSENGVWLTAAVPVSFIRFPA
ncbi:MAG: RNA 2'-phosphotransferase [Hyphomicrobiaceae bacterium]